MISLVGEEIAQRTTEEDVFILHFSGHGGQRPIRALTKFRDICFFTTVKSIGSIQLGLILNGIHGVTE